MPARPDYVDIWIFRVRDGEPEMLMLRRAAGRLLAGLWQCVAGSIEAGESIVAAALREVDEETGIRGEAIDAFYSLDLVASFLWETSDEVLSSVHFALRVAPGTEPALSHEHDERRWLSPDAAMALSVWPAYREAIARVRDNLLDPIREPWFVISDRAIPVD